MNKRFGISNDGPAYHLPRFETWKAADEARVYEAAGTVQFAHQGVSPWRVWDYSTMPPTDVTWADPDDARPAFGVRVADAIADVLAGDRLAANDDLEGLPGTLVDWWRRSMATLARVSIRMVDPDLVDLVVDSVVTEPDGSGGYDAQIWVVPEWVVAGNGKTRHAAIVAALVVYADQVKGARDER